MAKHLLTVWNPGYEADALRDHIEVLLRTIREHKEGKRSEDEVFVWWGKVHSNHRLEPMPHLQSILDMDESCRRYVEDEEAPEILLYLTDYRSLYVAHLGEITKDDMSDEAETPGYYRSGKLTCDCWFMLLDIRRLVHDDTTAVVRELKKLRNTRYQNQPVSLYGGMVDLPLIVTRDDEMRWFDPETRERMIDGRFWAEWDAEFAGAGAMHRELRENRFGNLAWESLDPAARSFLASAESVYRVHRDDLAFDLHGVVNNLANAVEVQVNSILQRAMLGAPDAMRWTNIDGVSRDLAKHGPFSLGALERAIGEDKARFDFLRGQLMNGEWFTSSLPAILGELVSVRNPAAHGGAFPRPKAMQLRNQLLGVGSMGDLLQLALVRVKAR